MRTRSPCAAILLVFLAACGEQPPPTPPGSGAGEGGGLEAGLEAGPAAATPDERPTLVGKFITTEGEHTIIPDGRFVMHVSREGQLLNYRLQVASVREAKDDSASTTKGKSSTGPTVAAIDPNSNWFIHVESPNRYWVFDGGARVELIEFTESSPTKWELSMTDLPGSAGRLLTEMPDAVRKRLPEEALAWKK